MSEKNRKKKRIKIECDVLLILLLLLLSYECNLKFKRKPYNILGYEQICMNGCLSL